MRSFGILLHISSLPSRYGIGDLGPAAHDFVRSLKKIGASVWQFLPLNPTSTFIGNSPYSSFSAFAGNPLFISPEFLLRDKFIAEEDLETCRHWLAAEGEQGGDCGRVNYQAVTSHREKLLSLAFEHSSTRLRMHVGFQEFCRNHDHWLHDHARFVSIKNECRLGGTWADWPEGLRLRQKDAMEKWDKHARISILKEKFIQYLFFSQWEELRETCTNEGVLLFSDVPIYVTLDSADVWANPHLFQLDDEMHPVDVSGVPPDYFSETGQRWGTPLYRWDVMEKEDFVWWKRRLSHVLFQADMARLDHFRGFCGYWAVPAEDENAVNGKWVPAPGRAFLQSMKAHLGKLPFLAEDLGVITADVRETMKEFDLPGMQVLQFAFAGGDPGHNPGMPHYHSKRMVVYTGTHDNAPTRAWFDAASLEERQALASYVDKHMEAGWVSYTLTRMAFGSPAELAVLPMQDALDLGADARMNVPGVSGGNWSWRMLPEETAIGRIDWLTNLARIYGRLPSEEVVEEETPLY